MESGKNEGRREGRREREQADAADSSVAQAGRQAGEVERRNPNFPPPPLRNKFNFVGGGDGGGVGHFLGHYFLSFAAYWNLEGVRKEGGGRRERGRQTA